jgi:drug/metabolite transporter (DMT)-like permease
MVVANWGQELKMSSQWGGEGYMILAGLTGAIGTIMAKELTTGIDPFAITGWELSLGGLVILIIGLPMMHTGLVTITPFEWGLLIYSAVLSAVASGL